MVDAVVLAGGTDRGEIVEETGIAHRPLLEVGGQSIVQGLGQRLRGGLDPCLRRLVAISAGRGREHDLPPEA